ncbi:hypothetical protein FB639_006064, partial [Coemansia asiatica]
FKADETSKNLQTDISWRFNKKDVIKEASDNKDDDYDDDDEDDVFGLGNDLDSRSVISQEDQNKYQEALTPGDLTRTTSFFGRLDLDIDQTSPTLRSYNRSNNAGSLELAKEKPSSIDCRDDSQYEDSNDGNAKSSTESDIDNDDGIKLSALSRSTVRAQRSEDKDSASEAYSDSSDADENGGSGGGGQQDTILFTGKLHAKQGLVSKDSRSIMSMPSSSLAHQRRQSNAVSPSPIPRSVWHSSIAEYPQRVMKKSQQQRRSERAALQLKDNLRMVESLRRMGKWQDSAWTSTVVSVVSEQASRANQFYFDPVIVCMSPRLVPQQPSAQKG